MFFIIPSFTIILSILTTVIFFLIQLLGKKQQKQNWTWIKSVRYFLFYISFVFLWSAGSFFWFFIKPLPGISGGEVDQIIGVMIAYPLLFGVVLPIFILKFQKKYSAISAKSLENPVKWSFDGKVALALAGAVVPFAIYYYQRCDQGDAITYFFTAMIFIVGTYFYAKRHVVSTVSVILIFLAIDVVYIYSANRLLGYPDDFDDSSLGILLFCCIHVGVFWLFLKDRKKAALICVLVLYFPILELQKDFIRQVIGYAKIDFQTAPANYSNAFISRIMTDRIYVLEREKYKTIEVNTMAEVVVVYEKNLQTNHFVFPRESMNPQKIFVIHGLGGSMEEQTPNFSWVSLKLMPEFFRLFR